MKKITPLLALLALSFWLNAQVDLIPEEISQIFPGIEQNASLWDIEDEQYQHDSTITTNFDDQGNPYTRTRTIYEYEDNGKVSKEIFHWWDTDLNQIYVGKVVSNTYDGADHYQLEQRADGVDDELKNYIKRYIVYTAEGEEELRISEWWDEESASWKITSKLELIEYTPTLSRKYLYRWDEDLEEYYLDGRVDVILTDNTRDYTFYWGSDPSAFTPQYKYYYEYDPTTGLRTYFSYGNYQTATQVWKISINENLTIDYTNKTATLISRDRFTVSPNGDLIAHDSSLLEYDQDFNRVLATAHKRTDLGPFLLHSRQKYQYNDGGFTSQIILDLYLDQLWEPNTILDYYYSLLTAIVGPEEVFPASLAFANPANISEVVTIQGEEKDARILLLVSDHQGKMLKMRFSRSGDQVLINEFAKTPGIYLLTLQLENGDQKTYKMMVGE